MIQLYYSPGTACLAPHFLLEELGVPYELVLVDTGKQEHRQAAYLKLNPKGKIPFLTDGDFQLSESAAICLYLAENYASQAGPGPCALPQSAQERAHLLQWMFYLSNTLQAELLTYFYPDRLTEEESACRQVKAKATERIEGMLQYLDNSLAASSGKYLLGDAVSVADLFCFMLCRWSRGMEKPARSFPHIAPYLNSLFARPSIPKALTMEGLQAPFY